MNVNKRGGKFQKKVQNYLIQAQFIVILSLINFIYSFSIIYNLYIVKKYHMTENASSYFVGFGGIEFQQNLWIEFQQITSLTNLLSVQQEI